MSSNQKQDGKESDLASSKKKATNNEKIKELEERIAKTKYNKKTQRAIGMYKAQLAQLKEKEEARGKGGKKGEGYAVRKTGDGTVVLLGFPSVGKSSLLNSLTNADSPVGAYAFTTLTVIPGVLEYKHAKIQILDVPGIVKGASDGTGRGKEVLQVIRNADLIVILLDVFYPEHFEILKKEVADTGVRINQRRPDVKITKTAKNGIRIGKTVKVELDDDTISSILRTYRINNAEVLIREDINEDQLIDLLSGNKIYVPAITVVNKIDMANEEMLNRFKEIKPDIFISAEQKLNTDELKDLIFEKLNLIRIYLKEVQKKADMDEPLIIFKNSTMKDLCEKLHKDFITKFRYARLWGTSAKFDGQRILKLTHVLKDEDIVEIHLK